VFWNNWNKQKTNRNSSKFVKISTFLIPHTISSVCFSCFNTGSKHRNNRKFFCRFREKANRNRLSFDLFWFELRKKINGFEDPLIENVFWRFFFSLFWENSVCFGCFDTGPKHWNKPKKCFLVSRNKPKTTETDWVSVCFGWNRKKFDCFEYTLAEKHGNSAVKVTEGKDLVAVESSEESVVCGKVAVKVWRDWQHWTSVHYCQVAFF
jgi:hypothetical protein